MSGFGYRFGRRIRSEVCCHVSNVDRDRFAEAYTERGESEGKKRNEFDEAS
jgi:hypothetical protein